MSYTRCKLAARENVVNSYAFIFFFFKPVRLYNVKLFYECQYVVGYSGNAVLSFVYTNTYLHFNWDVCNLLKAR